MTAPSARQAVEEKLRSALPPEAILDTPAEYTVDGLTPAIVVAPDNAEGVAAVLAIVRDAGAAAVPWGGGSHMRLGQPPTRYDVAIDLRRLDRVVEHEPADLTVTVEAGIRLTDLQRRLTTRGQWLPLDPPAAPTATIGGILAVNASGPARVAHGSARDLLIGMTVATTRGDLAKSGGRVVKNVAGYDMGKLHIGALGTLGVICQASFRVAPLPASAATLAVPSPDLQSLADLTLAVRDAGLALNGLVLVNHRDAATWDLIVRLAGSEAAVLRSRHDLASLANLAGLPPPEAPASPDDLWPDIAALCRPDTPAAVVVKASVLPSESVTLAADLDRAGASIVSYPTVGIAYGRWSTQRPSAEALVSLRDRCAARGGALVVEAAPVDLKRKAGVWGPPREDFAIMRRLKDEMDPAAVLNPGRYLGGI